MAKKDLNNQNLPKKIYNRSIFTYFRNVRLICPGLDVRNGRIKPQWKFVTLDKGFNYIIKMNRGDDS